MGEVKKLANETLNVTNTLNVIRNDLIPNNKFGKYDEKIKSLVNMLCTYAMHLEARARTVKFEVEKDEGPEIIYDIEGVKYNINEKDV